MGMRNVFGFSVALLLLVGSPIALMGAEGAIAQSSTAQKRTAEADRLAMPFLQKGIQQSEAKQLDEAAKSYQQALKIYRDAQVREKQPIVLLLLGGVYQEQNNSPKAIEYYEQGLIIAREFKDSKMESLILSLSGIAYFSMGNYSKAISILEDNLIIARKLNDKSLEVPALMTLGYTHFSLGGFSKAIQYQEKALNITREIKDRRAEAQALNGLGLSYWGLKNYPKSIEYQEQNLIIARELKDRRMEGNALGNLGINYSGMKNYTKTMEYAQQQLVIAREIKFREGEAAALANIGASYHYLGNYAGAIDYQEQGLAIARERKDSYAERLMLEALGLTHTKQEPELAISFYKQAINISETVRGNIKPLNKDLQSSYTQSISESYRKLADLLLTQNRPAEAQKALELLKIQELKDYAKVAPVDNKAPSQPLTPIEQPIFKALDDKLALGSQLTLCEQTNCAQKNQLIAQRDAANQQYIAARDSQKQQMRKQSTTDSAQLQSDQYTIAAQKVILSQPNSKIVLVYPLVLDDKIWLVVGSQAGKSGVIFERKEISVSREELNKTVSEFQLLLSNGNSDPAELQKVSQKLYKWLIAPIRDQLDKNGVKQIVFSPDRATRYIPMAALHDGKQYLVENFAVSTILTAETDTTDKLSSRLTDNKILGLGMTQAVPQFSALPFVKNEIDSIIQTTGLYPGRKLFDRDFTETTLRQNIGDYRILHIATHGQFVPGKPEDSYLLMGDGQKLSITSVKSMTALANTHLVVLSACETGKGGADGDGMEIAGIGHYFLLGGAKSVMPSLWLVNDSATSLLMSGFYGGLSKDLSKAEALRQVQISFINGKVTTKDAELLNRAGAKRDVAGQPSANSFAHPYYWAPFILIGNSQ